jgi:hypothetical protein
MGENGYVFFFFKKCTCSQQNQFSSQKKSFFALLIFRPKSSIFQPPLSIFPSFLPKNPIKSPIFSHKPRSLAPECGLLVAVELHHKRRQPGIPKYM